MTQLSKHFKAKEFACKCGCGLGLEDGDVSNELVDVLEDAREHFDKPVVINSGVRCEVHNRRVGGAVASQHLFGTAADIRIAGVLPKEVANYLDSKYPNKYGIGRYGNFTHIDVRPNKARWNG